MFRFTSPLEAFGFARRRRVSFLGCSGPDNEGALLCIKPCQTWGSIAEVLWDSGETSHVRYADLKYL